MINRFLASIGVMTASLFLAVAASRAFAEPESKATVPVTPSTEFDAQKGKATAAGVEAVVYGLPLVMMELTKQRMTNVQTPDGLAAPTNQFAHAPIFPPATFKNVVRANVDTLYSSAFLDLSAGPLILSVPDTAGRYYVLQMMDAWTNVFAAPGARTTGTQASTFAITGPNWTGTLPAGVRGLKSPTNMAWILGRIQTNGPSDYAAVHKIQHELKLVPLGEFGRTYAPPPGTIDPSIDMKTPPVVAFEKMSSVDFLSLLAKLLKSNPPPASDAREIAELATIGVVPGQPFDPSKLDPATAKGLELSVKEALARIRRDSPKMGTAINGWVIPKSNVGAFGTDYEERAFIGLVAIGANLPEDAVYPTAFLDKDGDHLSGSNKYILHFASGATPPVKAFWSVTMYDSQSFFVPNAINRQAISSWMPLERNGDGSLDIFLQHESPGGSRETNWLPAPAGDFNVTLRMYWPKTDGPSIIDGSWKPPAITRVK